MRHDPALQAIVNAFAVAIAGVADEGLGVRGAPVGINPAIASLALRTIALHDAPAQIVIGQ